MGIYCIFIESEGGGLSTFSLFRMSDDVSLLTSTFLSHLAWRAGTWSLDNRSYCWLDVWYALGKPGEFGEFIFLTSFSAAIPSSRHFSSSV